MNYTATIISIFILTFISAQEIVAVISPIVTNDNQGKSVFISDTRSAYSAGEFNGEFELGGHTAISNSHQTVFFTKLNSQGSHEWLNSIRGSRDVFASKILTKDNKLIIGGIYSDSVFIGTDTLINVGQKGIYIAVYDTLGNYQYSLNPTCTSAALTDLILTDNNELVAVGNYFQEIEFAGQNYNSPLGTNFFVLNYNLSNQTENWFQHSTGSNTNAAKIRLDSNGDIIVVGSYGQGVVIGTTTMFDNGTEHNTYVAKYNSSGNFLWAEAIIGLSQIHGFGLTIGDNNDIFVCGEFELTVSIPDGSTMNTKGMMDGLVYKYDTGGNYQWAKQIGGIDEDSAIDMVIDINGNPIVLLNSGTETILESTTMYPNGFNEPLIVKLNKFDGSHIWHKRIPSLTNSGVVLSSSIDICDSLICVTGKNYTGIEYNNAVIVSNNLHDYFLAVLLDHDYAEYVSIDEISSNNISVYPNPFNTEINISSEQQINRIEIYTMDGKLVYSKDVNDSFKTILPNLISGEYLLKIKSTNNTTTTKITKL